MLIVLFYNLRLESVTLTVNVDPLVTRPESKPPGVLAEALATKYVHGCAKDDWVTECGIVLPKPGQDSGRSFEVSPTQRSRT